MARNPLAIPMVNRSREEARRLLLRIFDMRFEITGDISAPSTGENQILWDLAYGEYLVFAHAAGNLKKLPGKLPVCSCFGPEAPDLQELLSCTEIATVSFPVCAGETSRIYRMYLFRGIGKTADHKRFLCGAEIIPEDISIFLSSDLAFPETKIDGASWQLAFHLAARAMENPKYRKNLAYDWLITGACVETFVEKVEIGSKVNCFAGTPRNIMLPMTNLSSFPTGTGVRTLNQAWTLISGAGIIRKDAIGINDEETDSLHILVGGSYVHIVTVILLLWPKKITFWHSEETSRNTDVLMEALSGVIPAEMQKHIMESHDLQQAFLNIDCHFRNDSGERALICNTGGNRLMGTAALLSAKARNIKVVYRDRDAADDTLTVIQFGAFDQYESNDITINRCPLKNVNWKWLYSFSNDIIRNSAELRQHFLCNR